MANEDHFLRQWERFEAAGVARTERSIISWWRRAGFDDVIGADTAKEELKFFIDYLKNPRRFMALGLNAPKGVLLHGPPGTGKTMPARAMAGESNVAFIAAAASGFVIMCQGSGPQSVRDPFARARRYAPASCDRQPPIIAVASP
jgi:ATP-dependent Zn protease